MEEKLKPLAKQFFGINSGIKEIFITEDKHCWYVELDAKRHCKGEKQYFKFTPSDFVKKAVVKSKPQTKPQVKKEE